MLEWSPGEKHSETPKEIFKNVREADYVRRVLIARCKLCGATVSTVPEAIKEVVGKCSWASCYCQKTLYGQIHRVCDVCYTITQSLYNNVGLKNVNYFKNLDESDQKTGKERRKRMGLDDDNS